MQMLMLVMGILAALILGNSYGRLVGSRKVLQMIEETPDEFERTMSVKHSMDIRNKEHSPVIRNVVSPVTGTTDHVQERNGLLIILIYPQEDKLYSPVSGRISKVYPMGNEFLLQTDFGTELHLCVGSVTDDLMGCHYLPRVVPNEVVSQGKLLLEFDRKILEELGQEILIMLEIKTTARADIKVCTEEGREVKKGEKIMSLRMIDK